MRTAIFIFTFCFANSKIVHLDSNTINAPRTLTYINDREDPVKDLAIGIDNLHKSFYDCRNFFQRNNRLDENTSALFAKVKSFLFLNGIKNNLLTLTPTDYLEYPDFWKIENDDPTTSKVFLVREIFSKLEESEYINCLPLFDSAVHLLVNIYDSNIFMHNKLHERLTLVNVELNKTIQNYNILREKTQKHGQYFDHQNYEHNKRKRENLKSELNRLKEMYQKMTNDYRNYVYYDKQKKLEIIYRALSLDFNMIHHVWSDDQSKVKLEGQKLDLVSKLVVRLEFKSALIYRVHSLCSGFLVTKKDEIGIAAGGKKAFHSVFTAYHCISRLMELEKASAVFINIYDSNNLPLLEMKLKVGDIFAEIGVKAYPKDRGDDFYSFKLSEAIEVQFDSDVSIVPFPDNNYIRNSISGKEVFVGGAGYPGISSFKDQNIQRFYKIGGREKSKDRKLAVVEFLNPTAIGKLFTQDKASCRKNNGIVYCEKSVSQVSGGVLGGMSGGLSFILVESNGVFKIIYFGVIASFSGTIDNITRQRNIDQIPKLMI